MYCTIEASNRTNDARDISMTPASAMYIGNATGSPGTNMGKNVHFVDMATYVLFPVFAKKQAIHAIDLLRSMPGGTMVYST